MSRTTRIYNLKSERFSVYHKYKQLCMGHCKCCKDVTISKHRRINYKKDLIKEIENI